MYSEFVFRNEKRSRHVFKTTSPLFRSPIGKNFTFYCLQSYFCRFFKYNFCCHSGEKFFYRVRHLTSPVLLPFTIAAKVFATFKSIVICATFWTTQLLRPISPTPIIHNRLIIESRHLPVATFTDRDRFSKWIKKLFLT